MITTSSPPISPPRPVPQLSVAAAVAASAVAAPEAIAVVDGEGRAWTWEDLAVAAAEIVIELTERGIGPGDRVAVFAPSSSASRVAAWVAVWALTAVLVTVDADLPPDHRGAVLARTTPARLLTPGPDAPEAAVPVTRLAGDHPYPGRSWDAAGWAHRVLLAAGEPNPLTAAYLHHRSLDTGYLIGAARTLAHAATWMRATTGATAGDRVAHVGPVESDLALYTTWMALTSGAALYLPPPDLHGAQALEWAAAQQITIITATSGQSWFGRDPSVSEPRSSAMRTLLLFGAPTPVAHLARWRRYGARAITTVLATPVTGICCAHTMSRAPAGQWCPLGTGIDDTIRITIAAPNGRCCAEGSTGLVMLSSRHGALDAIDIGAAGQRIHLGPRRARHQTRITGYINDTVLYPRPERGR
ncbi:AMP-binding protein [Nocardia puris]|uniref:AMP-binding protein n=1 Tax=Nocardia puris TaxID=208602 RepID=UPI002E1F8E56